MLIWINGKWISYLLCKTVCLNECVCPSRIQAFNSVEKLNWSVANTNDRSLFQVLDS
jgi:hypothetical protein